MKKVADMSLEEFNMACTCNVIGLTKILPPKVTIDVYDIKTGEIYASTEMLEVETYHENTLYIPRWYDAEAVLMAPAVKLEWGPCQVMIGVALYEEKKS